mmetsp:Transcript_8706/g.11963  ORF Transcript_8706/g.11963 Transcript_8706/m.11963 type:complete len:211 (+) Transcript_8706:197-829(+)
MIKMVHIPMKVASKLLSVALLLIVVQYLVGVSTKSQQPFFASSLTKHRRSSFPYHHLHQRHRSMRTVLPPSLRIPRLAQQKRERSACIFAEFGNNRQDRGPTGQAKRGPSEEKTDPRRLEPPPPPPREDEPVARPFVNWLRVAKKFSTDVKDPPAGGLKGVLWAFGSTFLEASLLILAVVVAAAIISFIVYSIFDRDFSNTFNPDIWYGS